MTLFMHSLLQHAVSPATGVCHAHLHGIHVDWSIHHVHHWHDSIITPSCGWSLSTDASQLCHHTLCIHSIS